jgi:hypothetical protein
MVIVPMVVAGWAQTVSFDKGKTLGEQTFVMAKFRRRKQVSFTEWVLY